MTEPVLMIPGLMCDARAFLHQVNALGADRLVTMALPLQGTKVEDMAKTFLEQAPPRFSLVGLGLGGDIALDMARRAPDRISRMVLISTDPLAEPQAVMMAREGRMIAARAGRLMDALADEIPDAALADSPLRARVRRKLEEMWKGLGVDVFLRQSKAMQRRPDHQRTLRQTNVPCLILAGEQDTLVPVRRQEFMAGMLPFARMQIIPGAGHLPTMEAPDAVNAALLDFLAGPMVLKLPPLVLE
ncbi:alpha/beta fold hydrolase [Neogemmobacter tilapiae]|uniref:Hydrolase n=1 Tax=Neogemmobacter tilapiae TaxID=875041 RepID=A0A918TH10_9RHOB|nr:alpha/beta hydrolase [Gemmobacter tilapiae]GHC48820.1 hydrolase [Gemmobacter tilapiae]